MVTGLCHFDSLSFIGNKRPREKTKRRNGTETSHNIDYIVVYSFDANVLYLACALDPLTDLGLVGVLLVPCQEDGII